MKLRSVLEVIRRFKGRGKGDRKFFLEGEADFQLSIKNTLSI